MTAPDEMTRLRSAVPEDAARIAEIYAYHVLNGTATFDYDPPSAEDWRNKIVMILGKNWPLVVAERAGAVVGYSYATQFRDRAAYRHTCENSIYVAHDLRGQGIGVLLLNELLGAAARCDFHQMIAVIGGGEPASVALHAKCGFRHAGQMTAVGIKFGRLLDTVYMQKALT